MRTLTLCGAVAVVGLLHRFFHLLPNYDENERVADENHHQRQYVEHAHIEERVGGLVALRREEIKRHALLELWIVRMRLFVKYN